MDWKIVTMQPAYLPGLRQLYLDSRAQTFTWLDKARFASSDFDSATQDEEIRVAVVGEKPIGFVSWWPPDNFIHTLFVDYHFHHKGIGKALLDESLAQVGRPASLKCLQQNTNAVQFYQRQGWRIQAGGQSNEGAYFLMTFNQ
ncbi:GNAT family N-acetyltransferase [Spirosoma sp. RP8]|uniref:GNAT family N-acetyltransferase n=1 Tax=Spirosoma liriopis TaxID=2937440 RepID=A0ABT0HJ62_9BACT|nr:GNAT family N-acetyltransferase [Spirosoma liriopis]MCK8492198.1 GNAT family N-acetyltransferase [Spirosoma liriopis]